MGFRRSLSFLLVASTMLRVAHAEDAGVVRVGGPCTPPGTTLPEILRVLQAELAPVRVVVVGSTEVAPSGADVAVGIEACTDTPPAARVTFWSHGSRTERVVELTDAAPGTRDRTLALALAETLRGVPGGPTFLPSPAPTLSPVSAPTPSPSSAPTRPRATEERPDAASAAEGRRPSKVALRAGVAGRFLAAESTPFIGIDAGIAWKRLGVGVILLGTHRSTELGAATLVGAAATVSFDAVELGPIFEIRALAELGVATASGSPTPGAAGHTATAPHVAAGAGVAAGVPLDAGWALEGFLGGGDAWSLTASVDGRRALGLDGWFGAAVVGVRLPVSGL